MGNKIFIENKKVCVKPLRNRLEAIQKLKPPKTPKGRRSFAGPVNFLSMFCPLGKRTAGLICRNKKQINETAIITYAK